MSLFGRFPRVADRGISQVEDAWRFGGRDGSCCGEDSEVTVLALAQTSARYGYVNNHRGDSVNVKAPECKVDFGRVYSSKVKAKHDVGSGSDTVEPVMTRAARLLLQVHAIAPQGDRHCEILQWEKSDLLTNRI